MGERARRQRASPDAVIEGVRAYKTPILEGEQPMKSIILAALVAAALPVAASTPPPGVDQRQAHPQHRTEQGAKAPESTQKGCARLAKAQGKQRKTSTEKHDHQKTPKAS
jgi:hypothetical protein